MAHIKKKIKKEKETKDFNIIEPLSLPYKPTHWSSKFTFLKVFQLLWI